MTDALLGECLATDEDHWGINPPLFICSPQCSVCVDDMVYYEVLTIHMFAYQELHVIYYSLVSLTQQYSRIPLSRAPLTRENQLVALAPWTPKFSDAPLAAARMTNRQPTCWCEQISPLAHSSQATWQPFNLSHCIEMHNTQLLGRSGQLSQVYFTHSAPILTPRNLPPTVNKQWPPLRESRMSRHTRFNTSRKTATAAMNGIFLGTNTVDRSIRPSVRIPFCISIVSKMSKS